MHFQQVDLSASFQLSITRSAVYRAMGAFVNKLEYYKLFNFLYIDMSLFISDII